MTKEPDIYPESEMLLRSMLWHKHGCPSPALYGDDGELQCSNCGVDFKRMSAEDISTWLAHQAHRNMKKAKEAKSCINCKHSHQGCDVEFTVVIHKPGDANTMSPPGNIEMNTDMFWCDIPEVEGEAFQLLTLQHPCQCDRKFLEIVAPVCRRYEEEK